MTDMVDTMFYTEEGGVPWHGKGKKLNAPPDTESAIIEAGLDREVELVAIKTIDGYNVPGNAVRYTDSPDNILSWVGEEWQPLQNKRMFKPFDKWVESGELSLHTAGSLNGGRKVWVLAEINNVKYPRIEIAKGDEIAKFVLLSNAHTYGRSIYFGFTPIRVVCANTEALAISSTQSKLLKIRHNACIEQNLDKIAETMDLINQRFEATAEQFRYLLDKQVANEEELYKYYRIVLGKAETPFKELPTNTRNTIIRLQYLYEHGRGQDLIDVRHSWYAAYNSVSEWLNHERGRNTETRLDSLWFGINKQTNQKALETAVVMAS